MTISSNENNIVYLGGRGVGKTTTGINVAKKTQTEYRDVDIETTARKLANLGMERLEGITGMTSTDLTEHIKAIFKNDIEDQEKVAKNVIEMIKEGALDIKTYSQIVGPDIWHTEGSYFRNSESEVFGATFSEAPNIITGAGTLKFERNRAIAKASFKLLFVIDTKVQLERIFNDPDGDTRRGIIGSADGCDLSSFEREERKLKEYDSIWLPILINFADKVIDVTEMNESETMDTVLEMQRVQDILQYNG